MAGNVFFRPIKMEIISWPVAILALLTTLVVKDGQGLSSSHPQQSFELQQHLPQQQQQQQRQSDHSFQFSSSRRTFMTTALGGLLTSNVALTIGSVEDVFAVAADHDLDQNYNNSNYYRSQLLELLQSDQHPTTDGEILAAIEQLIPFDPSKKAAATLSEELDGEWKLLWSIKAEAFSPLLRLPPPFQPSSYQYLGSAASGEVGTGRVAQGLTGGVLRTSQLWLSSRTEVASDDPSVLEIFPPFRLEFGGRYKSGQAKTLILEGGYLSSVKFFDVILSHFFFIMNKSIVVG
jgi:hypothetical protein